MFGFVARKKAIKKNNRINVVNEEEIRKQQESMKKIEKHISNNTEYYNYRNTLIERIERNIEERNYLELSKNNYQNTNALIYCCKNIETRHLKHFKKKSFAKLIYKLLELNIGLEEIDKNGCIGLMYLFKYITKDKYIKIIERYLELLYIKYNKQLRFKLLHTDKYGLSILEYINTNLSNNKVLINKLYDLISFYI